MGSPREFGGRWVWLFPLTYLVHAIEEIWGGSGYAAWVSDLGDASLSEATLVFLHLVLLAGMCVVVGFVRARRRYFWSIVAFGVVVTGNALMHLVATIATWSYSPGLLTGVFVWAPLGVYCLVRAGRLPRSDRAWGVAIGAVATVVITAVALDPGLLPLP